MFGWHVPSPNEAMLISGGRRHGDAPFRIIVGHGAFAVPVRNKTYFLTLAMQEAEVAEPCVTQQGITLQVRGYRFQGRRRQRVDSKCRPPLS